MAMSGRQHKVLDEQARRYGLPLDKPTISLPAMAKALHDLLAAHGSRLLAGGGDDALMQAGGDSPSLERWRASRADLAELDLAERQGELVKIADLEPQLMAAMQLVKRAGERLVREHGNGAGEILGEAVDEAIGEVRRVFATLSKKRKAKAGGKP